MCVCVRAPLCVCVCTWPSEHKRTLASISASLPCSSIHWNCATYGPEWPSHCHDDGQVSLLTLLDFSTAFDTTDHSILLHRLKHAFGVQKSALSFFRSYLSERQQTVSNSSYSSNPSTLRYGVPQGSVLGPILFLLYTQPLSQIIDRQFSATWTSSFSNK